MKPSRRDVIQTLAIGGLVCWPVAPLIAQSDTPNGDDRLEPDASNLSGKVLCGYQGWFNCEGDGAGLGWTHWARDGRRPFGPGNVVVDAWPDLSEFSESERYATGFRHADGRVAYAFSSFRKETVMRHFDWMRQYGIDGVFLQRFANGLDHGPLQRHKDMVLQSVRRGCEVHRRVYAVMYDLSGLRSRQVQRVSDDWKELSASQQIHRDARYLHHAGKPLVAVWGIGFNDGRRYGLQECFDLIESLKSGGAAVMVGVPSWWRDRTRDAIDDPLLHQIIESSDIVSPWSVGRYRTPQQALEHGRTVWEPDKRWCDRRDLDYLPVAFPGFSWHNLKGDALDSIPRRKGEFLWSQVVAARRSGSDMLYIAMFDEVDEGTAIFKCTSDPPVGEGVSFLDLEGLPSDFYLKLTGLAGQVMRGSIPANERMPDIG